MPYAARDTEQTQREPAVRPRRKIRTGIPTVRLENAAPDPDESADPDADTEVK